MPYLVQHALSEMCQVTKWHHRWLGDLLPRRHDVPLPIEEIKRAIRDRLKNGYATDLVLKRFILKRYPDNSLRGQDLSQAIKELVKSGDVERLYDHATKLID